MDKVVGMYQRIGALLHKGIAGCKEFRLGLRNLDSSLLKHGLVVEGSLYLCIDGEAVYAAVHGALIHQDGKHVLQTGLSGQIHKVAALHKLSHSLRLAKQDVRGIAGCNVVLVACNIGRGGKNLNVNLDVGILLCKSCQDLVQSISLGLLAHVVHQTEGYLLAGSCRLSFLCSLGLRTLSCLGLRCRRCRLSRCGGLLGLRRAAGHGSRHKGCQSQGACLL